MKNKSSLLRTLKENLNQRFLFIPQTYSFVTLYLEISLEFLFRDKLTKLAFFTAEELIERKVLAPQTIQGFKFNFKTTTFHDFYLKNYDGRSYSRGFSTDINEAFAKALGEVFERQFTEFPKKNDDILYSSLKDLEKGGDFFVDPRTYPQPTEKQSALFSEKFEYKEDVIFAWVRVKNLSNNSFVYALAQDAHWGFDYVKDEPSLTTPGTSGCGGGYTQEQALNSAMLEILQRDTFFRYWYFNKKPEKIDLESIPTESSAAEMVNNLRNEGFTVHILDMTSVAGIPTITAVIQRDGTGWFVGASSSLLKEKSILRALEEAFSIYMWTFQQAKNGSYEIADFIETPSKDDFLDERINSRRRCLLWGSKFYADLQNKFLVEGDPVPFKEESINKNFNLKDFLIEKFGEGYAMEAESEVLEVYNYHAVKVFFPKAYRLVLNEKYSRSVLNNVYPQNVSPHPFP